MQKLKNQLEMLLENKIVLGTLCFILIFILSMLLLPQKNDSFEKTHRQIGALAEEIHRYYARQPHYWGLSNAKILSENIVPANMNKDGKIMCALGREVLIGGDSEGGSVLPGSRTFMISIADLSKNACQTLASLPMDENANLSILKLIIQTEKQSFEMEWGNNPGLPLTEKQAKQLCGNYNILSWVFE